MTNTQPARGMRDFLPADIRKRNYVIGIIKEVYEKYGFEPLETPSVENLETLTGKYGEEGSQLMFKILKRGEKLQQELAEGKIQTENELSDLALRYDLTVPLARVVANYKNDLPKFFKRYQIQPVWRADRPAKGRYREFYQCDVDAIGSTSIIVEAELIAAVSEILKKLGFTDSVIRINHRSILTGILEAAGIGIEKHTDALIALDKIDKIGREGVEAEFKERGISENSSVKLLAFFEFFVKDKPREVFDEKQRRGIIKLQKNVSTQEEISELALYLHEKIVKEEILTDEEEQQVEFIKEWLQKQLKKGQESQEYYSKKAEESRKNSQTKIEKNSIENTKELKFSANLFKNLTVLNEVLKFAPKNWNAELGYAITSQLILLIKDFELNIKVDPTLARGLSYYTGTIMEVNVPDFAGSLAGGGRYDGLIGMFGKEQIPAVGFSIGLERIIFVMEERGMFPADLTTNSADVMVTLWNEDAAGESLKLAGELRAEGLRVLVYPEADKLGKQFKYADSINIPFVCVLGETELAENKVSVKNLKTGEQEKVSRDAVFEKIK